MNGVGLKAISSIGVQVPTTLGAKAETLRCELQTSIIHSQSVNFHHLQPHLYLLVSIIAIYTCISSVHLSIYVASARFLLSISVCLVLTLHWTPPLPGWIIGSAVHVGLKQHHCVSLKEEQHALGCCCVNPNSRRSPLLQTRKLIGEKWPNRRHMRERSEDKRQSDFNGCHLLPTNNTAGLLVYGTAPSEGHKSYHHSFLGLLSCFSQSHQSSPLQRQ